ncbi:MAG: penicillin acylase family protein, partial [Candidatus Dormibacteria bacterium]
MIGRSRLTNLVAGAMALLLLATSAVQTRADGGDDHARAVNVVPPGQSGSFSTATFAQAQAAGGSYGPNYDDQLKLFANWQYKPFQFEATSPPEGSHPGGNTHVTINRNSFGVPTIVSDNDTDIYYGFGYAMAQDRLFQLEVFRHVGHGTLAELVGQSGLAMDEDVRRVSEGSAARLAELAASPPDIKLRAQRFADGINQWITEASQDPNKLPAEFAALGDLPIATWTVDDTLAFGEYAGRFFGEFGHAEIEAAKVYLDMVGRVGQQNAEKAFNDLYALNDPSAPHIIPDADGTFPRHLAPPVASTFSGSAYANHDPSLLPPAASLAAIQAQVTQRTAAVRAAQAEFGIPIRLGSNAVVVDGSRTASGNPILYSGPQTGFAVPGFFWEAELRTPTRHQRGVTVPAVPLIVIGRDEDSTWSVTSALDGNADTFVEQLTADNQNYIFNGQPVPLKSRVEAINCNNPPTTVTKLPGQGPAALCPTTPVQLTVYTTRHGPSLADPDATHHLLVRQSTVDGHLVDSLSAWDAAGQQHSAAAFGQALSNLFLGFNFFYADAAGEIAYFRTGRYPLRPANADPNLPLPGTGGYEWQGFESWANTPHVVNPSTHFLVNWNNKPARDWWSKATLSNAGAPDRWGPAHHVEPLVGDVASITGMTLERMGVVPRDVAYLDARAVVLKPYLLKALGTSGDSRLQALRTTLTAWDNQRVDSADHNLHTAPVFFDRWVEKAITDLLVPVMGQGDSALELGLDYLCSAPPCHLVSVDNEDTPTFKIELAVLQVLINSARGRNLYDFTAGAGSQGEILRAAQEAAAELTAEQGADISQWKKPVESAAFGAQGAGSVPDLRPLPNRGSYGQVVEILAASAAAAAATPPSAPTTLPNTTGSGQARGLVLLLAIVLGLGLANQLSGPKATILLAELGWALERRRWAGRPKKGVVRRTYWSEAQMERDRRRMAAAGFGLVDSSRHDTRSLDDLLGPRLARIRRPLPYSYGIYQGIDTE